MDIQYDINEFFPEDLHAKKCGCYIRNPHEHKINRQSPMMPLKNIDYQLEIVNSLMNISLSQKYFNPSDKFLEVTYSFPIAPNSSVYKFYAEFNEVRIDGVVKEKEEAKKQFEEAKKEGRQAVMGTIDPLSKDIMNLEIGNIPPKTEFIIYISFMQEMSLSMNTFYKTQIPSTISPRYVSNYFEQLEKDKKKEGKVSGKPDFTWTFKVDLKTKRKVIFFDSPSHDITLLSQNETGTETLLAMTESCVPNKDFSFLYTTEDFHLPSYVLGRTDASSTVMLSFIPKFCSLDINDAYKASVENKGTETDIASAKGDYVFLLDRSGSMGGSRINKAKQALIFFLKSLPEDSFFNVISFGSSSQKMFNSSERYNAKSLEKAISKIKPMGADLGGTSIYSPLQSIFNEKVNKGYPKHIFLLTDGGVSNTEGVLKLIKSKTKHCRVHSIGIGNGASFNLIQGSAENGKGKFIMISDDQNPSDKIIELLEATLTPLISNINLKYDKSLVESIVPNPESIPYILKDDIINFYVTFKGQIENNTVFNFQYQDSISKLPYKSEIEVSTESSNEPFVDKMAHLKIIHNLEEAASNGVNIQEHMMYVKVKDYKKEAIQQSIKHQVLSQFTAFLCVQKKLVDGKYEEFVKKGVETVHIQQPQPIQYRSSQMTLSSSSVRRCKKSAYQPQQHQQMIMKPQSANRKMRKSRQAPQMNMMKESKAKQQSPGIIDSFKGLFGMNKKQQNKKLSLNQNEKFMQTNLKGQIEADNLFYADQIKMNKNQDQGQDLDYGDDFEEEDNIEISSFKKQQQRNGKKGEKKEKEKQSKKDVKRDKTNKKGSIQKVVNLQNTNGSWTQKSLIEEISKNPQKVLAMMKDIKAQILITCIVCEWIEKYHPEKKYALLVKKAKSWLKKTLEDAMIQEGKLEQLKNYI